MKKMSAEDQRVDDIMKRYGRPKPAPYTPPAPPEFPADEPKWTLMGRILYPFGVIAMIAPPVFIAYAVISFVLPIDDLWKNRAHPELQLPYLSRSTVELSSEADPDVCIDWNQLYNDHIEDLP